MDRLLPLIKILPKDLLMDSNIDEKKFNELNEIRVRVGQPLRLIMLNREQTGHIKVTSEHIMNIMECATQHSMAVYENDLRQGFITIAGGHRIGIGGTVIAENNSVKNFKYITFLCIRVAHEIIGCADNIMEFICKRNKVEHTLIVSPAGCGKTTLLRDIIRQLSNGVYGIKKNICVIDERSELAACYRGIPQNNLGSSCDVYDGCPKSVGMMMAIRSMCPEIIAVDEIGGKYDFESLKYAIHCGSTIIGTIHGENIKDIMSKKYIDEFIKEKVFKRIIVLSGNAKKGSVEQCIEL